jgi:D-alanyl-D-alanine carboxypeptidase
MQISISEAAKKKATSKPAAPRIQTSLVVDANTGKILHAENVHIKIYPASLAKGMTLYMLFEAIASGKISLDDEFYVSEAATKARPSKLYLQAGEK